VAPHVRDDLEARRSLALARKQKSDLSYQALADRTSYSKTTVYYVLKGESDATLIDIDRHRVLDELAPLLGGSGDDHSPSTE
jgi:hypothetical protein